MKIYYGRVSSKTQNLQRQKEEAKALGIEERFQFFDKESGKDTERPEFQRMFGMLRNGDILYVNSLDRLSRNYKDIQKVLMELRRLNVDLVVLDNSVLDTTKHKDLLGTLIFDLTVSLLGYVAEMERTKIKERQRAGIDLTLKLREKGLAKYGRPKIPYPENFGLMIEKIDSGEITRSFYRKKLGISKSTFYRMEKNWRLEHKES